MTPFDELQIKAESGDAQAQLDLALAYEYPRPMPLAQPNYVLAAHWFRKAAEQGLAEAQYKLGLQFQFGHGVEKSASEAVTWLSKAAAQGNDPAAAQLGWMFLQGQDIAKDSARAIQWFRVAADRGSAPAQYNLGNLFSEDRHGLKDDAQAVHWFRKAAEQSHDFAQYALGGMYAEGRGVGKDHSQALEWFRKAASNGNAAAHVNLQRWPPQKAAATATHRVEDLARLLQTDEHEIRILGIQRLHVGFLAIRLEVTLARPSPYPVHSEIFCFHAVDYSIRPKNPATLMGGPTLELRENHKLLENPELQAVPSGDGEVFRPPLDLKILVLDQSYVIAERFELRTLIDQGRPEFAKG